MLNSVSDTLMNPHRKKSQGVRSGDLGGHLMFVPLPTTCLEDFDSATV